VTRGDREERPVFLALLLASPRRWTAVAERVEEIGSAVDVLKRDARQPGTERSGAAQTGDETTLVYVQRHDHLKDHGPDQAVDQPPIPGIVRRLRVPPRPRNQGLVGRRGPQVHVHGLQAIGRRNHNHDRARA
jgi:hypothetical protein